VAEGASSFNSRFYERMMGVDSLGEIQGDEEGGAGGGGDLALSQLKDLLKFEQKNFSQNSRSEITKNRLRKSQEKRNFGLRGQK